MNIVVPKVVNSPANATVRVGSTISLYCNATGIPQPVIMWQKFNPEIKNTSTSEMLSIFNATVADSGTYRCVFTNAAGTTYSYQSTIVVYSK